MKISFLRYFICVVLVFCSCCIDAENVAGDTITVGDKKFKLLSDNIITNPGFEDGYTGWTDATTSAATLTSDNFSIETSGGVDNSSYLIGLYNVSSSSSGSIGTGWSIESGKTYLFAFQLKYLDSSTEGGTAEWLKVSLTNNKTSTDEPDILLDGAEVDGEGVWSQNYVYFTNSDAYSYVVARFRWLNNLYGFDDFILCEATEVINIEELQATINEAQALCDSLANGASDLLDAITTAQGYLFSTSLEDVRNAITDLEAAILAYKYVNASAESPLDLTDSIQNPGFDANTTTGWVGGGTVSYHEVEYYETTFDIYQKITGLPAGKYKLSIQGFERPEYNDAGAAYSAGTETIYAYLYAQSTNYAEVSVTFNSLYQHTYTGTGNNNGYINTMSAAETFFTTSSDYYKLELSNIVVDEGGTLTIGAKSELSQSGYWALFDNFQLEYLGEIDSCDIVFTLENRIEEAQELLSERMQDVLADSLSAVIVLAQNALSADSLKQDDLIALKALLDAAVDTAYLSVNAYVALAEALENANTVLDYLEDSDEITTLQMAIDTADNVYNNITLTIDEINNATTTLETVTSSVGKQIYECNWLMGDIYDESNTYYIGRSMQSKNWIIFWGDGLTNMTETVTEALEIAEYCFDFYADSLKFIEKGSSISDNYKMIIRIPNTSEWVSNGSGVDDMIGLCTLGPSAILSRSGQTLAHEIAHCFQYQVHCDNGDSNGWMYGFGDSGSGGCAWWENCAQWQGYKIYSEQQFGNEWFSGYLSNVHMHILHETPRYQNYFIQDYWCYKNGMDIIGRLWNESYYPEDPVQTYQRITGISQSEFNDEMWNCAARFASWDIPALEANGENYISSRSQPTMNDVGDDFWQIDADDCIENYGHNIIRLRSSTSAKTVKVFFEGMVGASGFRDNYEQYAGWRYGLVAMTSDGTRYYSDMKRVNMSNNKGLDTLTFDSPANCLYLWLVVSGAPSSHWRHAWDDDDTNDEQWPYQVTFDNTNLYGYSNMYNVVEEVDEDALSIYTTDHTLIVENISSVADIRVYNIQGICLVNENVSGTSFITDLETGFYVVSVNTSNVSVNRKVVVE